MTSNRDRQHRSRATRFETVTKQPAPLGLTVDDGRLQGPVFDGDATPGARAATAPESAPVASYQLPGH